MCQGSRDYQARKDRVKAKVMARSLYCFVIIDIGSPIVQLSLLSKVY